MPTHGDQQRLSLASVEFLNRARSQVWLRSGPARTISSTSPRTYVTRGDCVGVFQATDDELRYVATLKNLKLSDGQSLTPTKVGTETRGHVHRTHANPRWILRV